MYMGAPLWPAGNNLVEVEQLRRFLDLLPQMVWANEPDRQEQYYNAKWREFTGVDLGAGASRFNLIHPADRAQALFAWSDAQDTGHYEVEYRLRHHSGKYRWVVSCGNPRKDGSGCIVGWYGTCTDIHDKREAIDALRRSEAAKDHALRRFHEVAAKQKAVFESVDDGIIIHDRGGSIKRANSAAALLYGYTRTELHGKHIGELFETPPTAEELDAYLESLGREGKRRRVHEFASRRRDGSLFPVDVVTSPFRVNKDLHFIAVIRDVSERKRLEILKNEFISVVSHELRTPLTSIAGSLGLIAGGAAGALSPKAEKLINIAHSNSGRLVRLVSDILDLEKMQSGKMDFDMREVDLSLLLAGIVESNLPYAKQFSVKLELLDEKAPSLISCDPDKLAQVFTNLISNAVKFSPEGGAVIISVHDHEEFKRVTVQDRGSGIPDEFKPRVFSKFAQADGSNTKATGGSGLGLSIVKEIVLRTGGQISFESEVGCGSSFHVDLPRLMSSAS